MNSYLFNRQLGSISSQTLAAAQTAHLIKHIQHADDVHFVRSFPDEVTEDPGLSRRGSRTLTDSVHVAGVNSITIDPFEGRYLLSGGADSSVAIWDLEASRTIDGDIFHAPLSHNPRTSTTESLSITEVSFYPFDSLAFLTSGFDKTLKLFSSETLTASASFDLNATVYSHATHSTASHLLVACATQHPAVRLVDLNSGSTAHSLAGHAGSVLSVAWHPRHEHVLASGATDGSLRLWDIRRSNSSLGVLDMDDHTGLILPLSSHQDQTSSHSIPRRREIGRAHSSSVNGLVWTHDGQSLISTGHDQRMRVWDMASGANTLVNFGPALKNSGATLVKPLLVPPQFLPTPGSQTQTLYFPNPKEILHYEVHTGTLLRRMRIPAATPAAPVSAPAATLSATTTAASSATQDPYDPIPSRSPSSVPPSSLPPTISSSSPSSSAAIRVPRAPLTSSISPSAGIIRNAATRTTSLCWRAHNIEFYSAHADGSIRCWKARPPEDQVDDTAGNDDDDDDNDNDNDSGGSENGFGGGHMNRAAAERKRKREELDQIVRDLTSKRITFT